jgi:hypothetical protein
MREATLADGRNPAAKAFWHDGAFHALMLHLDYFQQTVLQQIDQQSQIAYRRLSPGFTARVPAPGSESVNLAFAVIGAWKQVTFCRFLISTDRRSIR